MSRAAWALLAALALTGCASADADPPQALTADQYYEAMRSVDQFAEKSDAELDKVSESLCDLIRAHPDGYRSGLGMAVRVLEDNDLSEKDRTMTVSASLAYHCPELTDG